MPDKYYLTYNLKNMINYMITLLIKTIKYSIVYGFKFGITIKTNNLKANRIYYL
jgi:hypothetical protein